MHLSLPKQFPLFILASSVRKSLQCLTSTLSQGGGGGHPFRLTCSVVLWGGGHCRQVSLACVGSARSVWATLGLPLLMACVRSPSALLRRRVSPQGNCLKWALGCVPISGLSCSGSGAQVPHKGTDSVGPAFCALPGSEQLGECTLSRWAARLITSPVPAARISGCAAGVLSQMCHVSPLGS